MSENEEKWTELGVTFKVLTVEDFDQIEAFLIKNFFSDEPIFRSSKLVEGSGFPSKQIAKMLRKEIVMPCLKDKTSIVAMKDGKIIGSRLGSILKKTDIDKHPDMRWMASLPSWLAPEKFITLGKLETFTHLVRYNPRYAFEDVPDAETFYHAMSLTVDREARGMGLGKEMISRTMKIGKDLGCSHVYILASSIYSQRIFQDFGFKILHEMEYDSYRTKNNKIFFANMQEHKTAQVVLYDLKQFHPQE